MTTEGHFETTTVPATVQITQDMLFKAGTLAGTLAASPLQAGGVIRYTAQIGQGLTLIYEGECKVKVGGAVSTLGYPLTITTSGFFIAATVSGGMTVGRNLTLAASGDLVRAIVDFSAMGAAAFA
jgi:hypothetical protein